MLLETQTVDSHTIEAHWTTLLTHVPTYTKRLSSHVLPKVSDQTRFKMIRESPPPFKKKHEQWTNPFRISHCFVGGSPQISSDYLTSEMNYSSFVCSCASPWPAYQHWYIFGGADYSKWTDSYWSLISHLCQVILKFKMSKHRWLVFKNFQ